MHGQETAPIPPVDNIIGSPLPVLDETHQMILAYDVASNPHVEGFGSNSKPRSALLNATYVLLS